MLKRLFNSLKQNSIPLSSKLSLQAYYIRHLFQCISFKYFVSKATMLPTKLGQSKTRWLLNKIKLASEKKTIFHGNKWWAASLFTLFPGLFEIIAQSVHGSTIHFFQCMWRLSGSGFFVFFCTLAYCLVPKKVPNKLISPI